MKKIVLVFVACCVFGLASMFVAGGALRPAKAADSQQWDYAVMVYASDDNSVVWVEVDPDRSKEMKDKIESLQSTTKSSIPYIYFASLAGRFGWELILERDVGSVTALTFKRPL